MTAIAYNQPIGTDVILTIASMSHVGVTQQRWPTIAGTY